MVTVVPFTHMVEDSMPSDKRELQSLLQLGVGKIICEKCGNACDTTTIEEIEIEASCFKTPEALESASAPEKKQFIMLCASCQNNPIPFYTL